MKQDNIGSFITDLRKEKNITQEQLASIIHVSRETISKWELGKRCPDVESLYKLSETFEVSVEELISGERKIKETDLAIALYTDCNRKNKIIKIILTLLIILILIFLIYYFFNTYNSFKVYNISYSTNDLTVSDGLLVSTKDNIYFNLGHINTNKDITDLELFYKDKDNKEHLIVKTDDLNINFKDFSKHQEYIDFNNLNQIVNNMYLKVTYPDEIESIKLQTKKSYANTNIFNKKKSMIINDKNQELSLSKDSIILEQKILKIFKKDNGLYSYETNLGSFIYIPENKILEYIVLDNKVNKEWIYLLRNESLNYKEYQNNDYLNSFIYENNNFTCNISKCQNTEEIINYFYQELNKIIN